MQPLVFWTVNYRKKKKSNNFSCFRLFLTGMRKELGTLKSNVLDLPLFDNVKLWSHLPDVKIQWKGSVSRTLHPITMLYIYHQFLLSGTLVWIWTYFIASQWMRFHIYSSITCSRIWTLSAFLRLFQCIVAYGIFQNKKSHNVAIIEAQLQPRVLEHSCWLHQELLKTRLTASLT